MSLRGVVHFGDPARPHHELGEVHGRRRRVVCVACVVREWRNGRERVVRAASVSMQRECECGVRTG